MYHYELSKSTLDVWGEEQDARYARQRKLTEIATLLQILHDTRAQQERHVENDEGDHND
ncbi:MAG: hypothetical protein WBP12_04510 [Candidatus Saccharimonas sp.]